MSNDSTQRPPKLICYQDTRDEINVTVIDNYCKATGQFVWIFQNNTKTDQTCPILEICEIQVLGKYDFKNMFANVSYIVFKDYLIKILKVMPIYYNAYA